MFSTRVLAFLSAAAILAVPRETVAQQTAFAQALTDLTTAIEGIYGDEGGILSAERECDNISWLLQHFAEKTPKLAQVKFRTISNRRAT